ncbi:hypothetical protein CPB84DRAFT_1840858 [Gymnopilus junonius]|uniref:Uncharacterized protein n=1 Tax=Gymnopilus junonius TaxID=109634 RepID=A0A9P5TUE7_GYMJU|nr:hypothetical protein CPB84DRAFT_1840858 [Gymnopilus junonius]
MRPRGATFSGLQPSGNLDFGVTTEESGRSTSASDEPIKITMRTRVAVRDKNPHRFQVIPLRDASMLQASRSQSNTTRPLRVPTTPVNYLLKSPSGTLSPYSSAKPLQSALSAQSLSEYSQKENCPLPEVIELNVNKTLAVPEVKALIAPSSLLSSLSLHGQNNDSALWEFDVNQKTPRSNDRNSGFLRFRSKGTHRRALEIRKLDPRDQSKVSGDTVTHGRTTTQSLHIRSHHDETHARSTSLSNLRTVHTIQDSISCIPSNLHQSGDNAGEGKSCSGDLENSQLLSPETHRLVKKSSSKKRHAIYTASLVLPDFDKLTCSRGETNSRRTLDSYSTEDEQHILRTPLQSNFGHSTCGLPEACEAKIPRLNIHVASGFSIRKSLENDANVSIASLRDEFCPPQNSSGSLCPSVALTDAKSASLRTSFDVNAGKMIYPQIILDLFAQIDQVIEDWS